MLDRSQSFVILTLLSLTLAGMINHATADDATTVYVTFSGEKRIARYSQDRKSGRLTPIASVAIPGHAGGLTTSPDRKYLFAALREEGRLASFLIESTGLKLLSDIPAGADPAYIATDRSGKFLLTAYYVANKVTVHAIDDAGRLNAEPVQSIPTAPNAHGILTDPTNRYVFVPHTSADSIFQFRFDPGTGRLESNEPAVLQRSPQTGPRHLAFHPKLPVVYIDNEQQSSVTWYRLDEKRGTLTANGTLSTLPAGFDAVNSNADVEIHPSGRFLYFSNRGHDSIAMFSAVRDLRRGQRAVLDFGRRTIA
ncbi:MAG: beta-propeller fold lactonase family protein [Planctomycetota bacterium]|nr:beta-propeller fold lactonase family protein [Planctomycetota bacterium]